MAFTLLYVIYLSDILLLRIMKHQQRTLFLFKMATECDSTVCENQNFWIVVSLGVEYVFSCMKSVDITWCYVELYTQCKWKL